MKDSKKLRDLYKLHENWIANLNHGFKIHRLDEIHIFDSGYGILKEIHPRHLDIIRDYKRITNLFLDIDIMLTRIKYNYFGNQPVGIMKKINENSKMILELVNNLIQKLEMIEKIQYQLKASNHQGKRA